MMDKNGGSMNDWNSLDEGRSVVNNGALVGD